MDATIQHGSLDNAAWTLFLLLFRKEEEKSEKKEKKIKNLNAPGTCAKLLSYHRCIHYESSSREEISRQKEGV